MTTATAFEKNNRKHPSDFDIERWHVGDELPTLDAHLDGCARCRQYLAQLDAERAELLQRMPVDAFLSKIGARLQQSSAPIASKAPRRGMAWTGAAVAVAGAFGWLLHLSAPAEPEQTHALIVADDVELAQPSAAVASKGKGEKLAAGMTLVLERQGNISLHRGATMVVPGDRLRVKIALERETRISVGLLSEEGEWSPLYDGALGRGEHSLSATMSVDREPVSGRLLFGKPLDVVAARRGAVPDGVQVIRLNWSASP